MFDGIKSRREVKTECLRDMSNYTSEDIEWWKANAWLQQNEKIENFHNYMYYLKENARLKEEHREEVNRLKAKILDLTEQLNENAAG